MIYVYKQSATPIHPWDVLRHGGPNNIAPEVRAKYLLLLNTDVVQRDGVYHYIFEFDTRDSLKKSGLAQLTQAPGKSNEYPNGMDWATWLSKSDAPAPAAQDPAAKEVPAVDDGAVARATWQVITADVRWEILHMAPANPEDGHRSVVITGLRPATNTTGAPGKGFLPAPASSPATAPNTAMVPAASTSAPRKYVQSRMFDDENLLLALPISA